VNGATATVIVLMSGLMVALTLWGYERALREERWKRERAEVEIATLQALLASKGRHPAGKRLSPDLTVLRGDVS
jgi:hypothetical protein